MGDRMDADFDYAMGNVPGWHCPPWAGKGNDWTCGRCLSKTAGELNYCPRCAPDATLRDQIRREENWIHNNGHSVTRNALESIGRELQ